MGPTLLCVLKMSTFQSLPAVSLFSPITPTPAMSCSLKCHPTYKFKSRLMSLLFPFRDSESRVT